MKLQQYQMFLLAGLSLILINQVYPLVTVVVDNTPPQFMVVSPNNGETVLTYTSQVAWLQDNEAAITNVYMTIDGGTQITMTLRAGGTPNNGYWDGTFTQPVAGPHTVFISATNEANLTSTWTGTITLYLELQGTWTINDIVITSPTQRIVFGTTSLTFKFTTTQGILDRCDVSWTGPEVGSYGYTSTDGKTWIYGPKTFLSGTYTMTLQARDSSGKIITLSIFDFNVNVSPTGPPMLWTFHFGYLSVLGLALIGVSTVMYFNRSKKGGK